MIMFGPPTPLAFESGWGQSDQNIPLDNYILWTRGKYFVSSFWIADPWSVIPYMIVFGPFESGRPVWSEDFPRNSHLGPVAIGKFISVIILKRKV